jgi:hypothetical protein
MDHRRSFDVEFGQANWQRSDIASQLKEIQGQHLVIIRYSQSQHNVHHEWVYNAADIDRAKIVWAREIPGIELAPLTDYYNYRKIWIVEADVSPPTLTPLSAASTTQPRAESKVAGR